MKTLADALRDRLKAWEDERETNRYGMQELADRAIALIEAEMERAGVSSTPHAEEER